MAGRYRQTRQKVWAYSRTPYLKRFYTAEQWQDDNTAREIKDLEARIRAGRGWLATIPTTDSRYPKWSCKLAALRLQLARLTADANRNTLRW